MTFYKFFTSSCNPVVSKTVLQSPLSFEKDFTDSQNSEGWDGLDWIHFAQNLDEWLAVVSKIMNLKIPQVWGISWWAKQMLP